MKTKYVLDSSAWIEYFRGSEKGRKIQEIVEKETIGTGIIAIAELSDKFEKEKNDFRKALQFIESKAAILNISVEVAVNSGKLKNTIRNKKPKFGLADALHLALAQEEEATLVTCDYDFEGLPSVMII